MTKRKNNRSIAWAGIAAFFSFYSPLCLGQRIETVTDKKDILIGEQIQYKVKASFPAGAFRVNWFSLPDSVAHFEVVDKSRVDSSAENGSTILQQTITFTSFDSGSWDTPSFLIDFDPVKDDTTLHLFTDPVTINVSYSPPDSTGQLRDIKPIIEVKTGPDYWNIILRSAVVFILIIIVIALIKRFRKKKPEPVFKESLSPYNEALKELKSLEKFNLQLTGEVKQYHTKLAGIFKKYLSRKQNKNLLTKTTGDLLIRMAEGGIAADNLSKLATALRCTDAVKFAKYMPLPGESEDCKQRIRETIDLTEHITLNP